MLFLALFFATVKGFVSRGTAALRESRRVPFINGDGPSHRFRVPRRITGDTTAASRVSTRGVPSQCPTWRGVSLAMTQQYPGVVLDFDGVLCDSVADTTHAAFWAANVLWPEDMKAALALDPRECGVRKSWVGGDWSEYADDRRINEDIPRWLEEKMRQLRPVVSRGSDAVLAVRLCVTDAVNSKTSSLGERPLAAGEIVENWDVLRESMLYRVKYRSVELEKCFEDQRPDSCIPLEEWVRRNPVFASIAASIAKTSAPIYVLTRRDEGFTKRVLEMAGVDVPMDRIIFAERGRNKADLLAEIVDAIGDREMPLAYVDDNVSVVREVVGDLRLAGKLSVYFAEWGYSSPSQKAEAAFFPRVTNVDARQFSDVLKAYERS